MVTGFLWTVLAFAAPVGAVQRLPELDRSSRSLASVTETADGSRLRVQVVIVAPSEDLVTKFGHSALWIEDIQSGAGLAYSFGRSDHLAPGFFDQMVGGRMRTWMEVADPQVLLSGYARSNRTIWVQELNLTDTQRLALLHHLNGLLDQSTYYDFVVENCTTGVRDALDVALGGALRSATDSLAAEATFRAHIRRLLAGDPLLDTSLNLIMGPRVDWPIDAWDEMFLPETLRANLGRVTIEDSRGRQVPLVSAEKVWFQGAPAGPERAISRSAYGLLGAALFAAFCLLGIGARARPLFGWCFVLLASLWLTLLGTAGVMLTSLWLWTEQPLAVDNENLLQANPVALIAAMAVLMAGSGEGRQARLASHAVLVVLALSLAGCLMKVLPGFEQANGALVAIILPGSLGLFFGLRSWLAGRAAGVEPSSGRSSGAAALGAAASDRVKLTLTTATDLTRLS